MNNFASTFVTDNLRVPWFCCQSHASRFTDDISLIAMKSQLFKPVEVSSNHCSAKICILCLRSGIYQVGRGAPTEALRASTAAPTYWSCPIGSNCEKSAWIRMSLRRTEVFSHPRYSIETGTRVIRFPGCVFSRLWNWKFLWKFLPLKWVVTAHRLLILTVRMIGIYSLFASNPLTNRWRCCYLFSLFIFCSVKPFSFRSTNHISILFLLTWCYDDISASTYLGLERKHQLYLFYFGDLHV